ncbi:MAG: nitronate monooxygenase [Nitriliruptoraceae bacterium]
MHPIIIQGGMGVGVSSWQLARKVASLGHLGVVSGTAVAVTVARRLAVGDDGGHIRRALDHFPIADMAARVYERHFRRSGPGGQKFRGLPSPTVDPGPALQELTVVASFVEVFLAREGTDGPVGVNLLEKIQLPTLPSLYGAMLADVDYVLMGAGVPVRIPAIIDRLAKHEDAAMPVDIAGDERGTKVESRFSPRAFFGEQEPPAIRRPNFLAIVSSATLATYLDRNSSGSPDGFVIEMPKAGGHNAPPRGRMKLDDAGEPVYGPRDAIDLDAIRALGKPFWLAGGYATPEGLREALAAGATGVQVGTAFALCDESGLAPSLKQRLIDKVLAGTARVRTDAKASPTGFPFKVAEVEGTLSHEDVVEARPRKCDLGYLREPYRRDDGKIGYRCASEPIDDYVAKGGDIEETKGRLCLCNGLLATIGLAQQRDDGYEESELVTAGDDLTAIGRYLSEGSTSYSAADVIHYLLQAISPGAPATASATIA